MVAVAAVKDDGWLILLLLSFQQGEGKTGTKMHCRNANPLAVAVRPHPASMQSIKKPVPSRGSNASRMARRKKAASGRSNALCLLIRNACGITDVRRSYLYGNGELCVRDAVVLVTFPSIAFFYSLLLVSSFGFLFPLSIRKDFGRIRFRLIQQSKPAWEVTAHQLAEPRKSQA